MRFVAAAQNAFTTGEVSPKLYHRVDLKAYQNGAKQLLNTLVLRQGGATRRTGSIHVDNTLTGNASRLVPFRRSLGVNYVIEVGHLYFAFFHNHARVSNGPPVTIATPYSAAQIGDLRFAQSGDVMFIVHPSFPMYKLSHFSDISWTLAPAAIKAGPLLPENIDRSIIVTASGQTGVVTLTASSGIFQAGDVGGIWRLKSQDLSVYQKWQTDTTYSLNSGVLSNGKVYLAVLIGGSTKSGTEAPDHTEGAEWDGSDNKIKWQYLNSGYANVTITGYNSPTSVTATVESGQTMPFDVLSPGTYKWSRAAWSPREGYPSSIGFFQERLATGKLNVWFLSTVGDFENMSPTNKSGEVSADSSFRFVISDPKVDRIQWFAPSQDISLIGTSGAEYSFGAQNTSDAFGPDNVACLAQSAHGSGVFMQPERIDDAVIFADRGGHRVYELVQADSGISRYGTRELSILAEHLTQDLVFEAAYCENPNGIVWFITETGNLIGLTYDKQQEVVSWHHHQLGGADVFIESICSIPTPDGRHDELWLQVARTVNGGTVRSIEYLSGPWENTEIVDACFSDCSIIYNNIPTQVVAVPHLEGQLVSVLADGVDVGDQVVTGGQVSFEQHASFVVVGLPYVSEIEPLTPDPGSEVGASMGKVQRMVRAYVHFNRTNHCTVGRRGGAFDVVTLRRGDQTTDAPTALFSGVREIDFPGGYDTEPSLVIRQDRPLPLEVYGLVWDMNVAAR